MGLATGRGRATAVAKRSVRRRQAVESAPATGTDLERDLAGRLRQAKLDLLPVLHELLRTRSVTRSARSLGMSQPAVSQALQRLRALFEDKLLVSVGRDLQLTSRAEALIGPLHRALNDIDQVLRPESQFDPASEAAHFVIATADYVSVLLTPVLTGISAVEAPNVVFEFVNAPLRGAEDLARLDFMLIPRAYGETLGKRLGTVPLWQDDIVCVAARSNRAIAPQITAEEFERAQQVGYQTNPGVPARVRALLQPTSILETARICTVPDFLVLGAIVEKTNCVALVPRMLAELFVRWQRLKIAELTYPQKSFAIDACWSLAATGKRGHAWAQQLLVRAANELTRHSPRHHAGATIRAGRRPPRGSGR